MHIEFRRVADSLISHKIKVMAQQKYETLYKFQHVENNLGKPFVFSGVEVLKKAGVDEEGFVKGYFVGVEQEGEITKLHILENLPDILTVTRSTEFKINDLVVLE